MNNQKIILITMLSLAFIFTASAAFADLNFGTSAISSDGALTLAPTSRQVTITGGIDMVDTSQTVGGNSTDPAFLDLYAQDRLTGIWDNLEWSGGNTANIKGMTIDVGVGVGTVTSVIGLNIYDHYTYGSGSITKNYGIYVEPQTAGTKNWNIYSGGAPTSDNWCCGSESWGANYFSTINSARSAAVLGLNEQNDTTTYGIIGLQGSSVALHPSDTRTFMAGVYGESIIEGNGDVAVANGIYTYAQKNGSGTVSALAGLKVDSNGKGGGTVTDNFGVKIEDQSISGANNYAIKTGLGLINFGDSLIQKNGGNVASATTTTLPGGNVFHITGTTNITTLNPCNAANSGRSVMLIFDGAMTFTDGNNLKLAGNFVTTADDSISLTCDGSNWYESYRSVN